DVLLGDPLRLNQVLMNLCGNALKFTERGSVALNVYSHVESVEAFPSAGSPTPFDKLRVTHVAFKVEDTGIGIPQEKLSSIFESFTQAHSSDSRKFGGTGLGLSISKQLIELMGGDLKAESHVGSGSTFSFELNFELGSEKSLHQQKKSEQEIDGSILNGL